MKVTVDVEEEQFGKSVSKRTIENTAQDIIDRYCNVEYFNEDELEMISKNEF